MGVRRCRGAGGGRVRRGCGRSEEHTSELQSQSNLVCRLLLEKKKTRRPRTYLELRARTNQPPPSADLAERDSIPRAPPSFTPKTAPVPGAVSAAPPPPRVRH